MWSLAGSVFSLLSFFFFDFFLYLHGFSSYLRILIFFRAQLQNCTISYFLTFNAVNPIILVSVFECLFRRNHQTCSAPNDCMDIHLNFSFGCMRFCCYCYCCASVDVSLLYHIICSALSYMHAKLALVFCIQSFSFNAAVDDAAAAAVVRFKVPLYGLYIHIVGSTLFRKCLRFSLSNGIHSVHATL